MKQCRVVAIIVASGNSTRTMGESSIPKQYLKYQGKMVLQHSIEAFIASNKIDKIIVTVQDKDEKFYTTIPENKTVVYVAGYAVKRHFDVFEGLKKAEEYSPTYVLIHDANRPFVSTKTITDVIYNLYNYEGVVPAISADETTSQVKENTIMQIFNRETLRIHQTPQGFCFKTLLYLYKNTTKNHEIFTDEASLMFKYQKEVKVIPGDVNNIKITHPKDLRAMEDC